MRRVALMMVLAVLVSGQGNAQGNAQVKAQVKADEAARAFFCGESGCNDVRRPVPAFVTFRGRPGTTVNVLVQSPLKPQVKTSTLAGWKQSVSMTPERVLTLLSVTLPQQAAPGDQSCFQISPVLGSATTTLCIQADPAATTHLFFFHY